MKRIVFSSKKAISARLRVLHHMYEHAGRDGLTCFEIGEALWPERVIKAGQGVSHQGGGDYAAQMLLGRLKKEGLVEHAPSVGSTRWRLTAAALQEVGSS